MKRIALKSDKFWVFYNHIEAELRFTQLESVTFVTHGEFQYLDNLIPLLKRWQGPLSMAIFAPGEGTNNFRQIQFKSQSLLFLSDFEVAMKLLHFHRHCQNESEIVRKYATFHLFFPVNHIPKNLNFQDFTCEIG